MEGKLDEYMVRDHTLIGEALLGDSTDPVIHLAGKISKYHHAWWNGCGYPEGILRDGIPAEARICAAADSPHNLAASI